MDIFGELFEGIGGCAMIAIIAGVVLLLVVCVVVGVVSFGIASWV